MMDVLILQNDYIFGGPFPALETCVAASRHFGNDTHVLSAKEWVPLELEELSRLNTHPGPNDRKFEIWNLCRWFILRRWMIENKISAVVHIDADVLLFESLNSILPLLPTGFLFTSPHCASFVTLEGANRICETVTQEVRAGTMTQFCAPDHVCDQSLIAKLGRLYHQPQLTEDIQPLMMDSNIEFLYNGHPREIKFIGGQPHFSFDGQRHRLLSLHCWGRAKGAMSAIWAQALRSLTSDEPVPLSY